MKQKKIKKNVKKTSILFLLKLLIVIGLFLYALYYILLSIIGSYTLNDYGTVIKGVIIRKESYTKNNFITKKYEYQYVFCTKGKYYEGPSQSFSFKPGDSILIKYWSYYPYVNQPVHLLEEK